MFIIVNIINTILTLTLLAPYSTPVSERIALNRVNNENVTLTPDLVTRAIRKMNNDRSSGLGGLSPFIFKQLSDSLALALSLLFESFMSTSSVPQEWRIANAVPIFKSGSSFQVVNYFPVSLICIACKTYGTNR